LNDVANRTEIFEEERSMVAIGVGVLNAHPFIFPCLGPASIQAPGGIDSAFSRLAAHAFKRHIARPAGRQDEQDVADDTIAADTKRRAIDEKAVFSCRADIKRQQGFLLRRGRHLDLDLLPRLAFVILLKIRGRDGGNEQARQQ
jgi:hypothetical protein